MAVASLAGELRSVGHEQPFRVGAGIFNLGLGFVSEPLGANSDLGPQTGRLASALHRGRTTHQEGASLTPSAVPEPSDYVLSILGAAPDRPVKGTLMLVKLMFLVSKEIDTRAAPEFNFFAFDYGPFSKVLMETVDRLVEQKAVVAGASTTDLGSERREYRLTEAGRALAVTSLDLLGPEIAGRLQKLRKGADQLGYNGILRLVYTRYPEFASASKIREEVLADPVRR